MAALGVAGTARRARLSRWRVGQVTIGALAVRRLFLGHDRQRLLVALAATLARGLLAVRGMATDTLGVPRDGLLDARGHLLVALRAAPLRGFSPVGRVASRALGVAGMSLGCASGDGGVAAGAGLGRGGGAPVVRRVTAHAGPVGRWTRVSGLVLVAALAGLRASGPSPVGSMAVAALPVSVAKGLLRRRSRGPGSAGPGGGERGRSRSLGAAVLGGCGRGRRREGGAGSVCAGACSELRERLLDGESVAASALGEGDGLAGGAGGVRGVAEGALDLRVNTLVEVEPFPRDLPFLRGLPLSGDMAVEAARIAPVEVGALGRESMAGEAGQGGVAALVEGGQHGAVALDADLLYGATAVGRRPVATQAGNGLPGHVRAVALCSTTPENCRAARSSGRLRVRLCWLARPAIGGWARQKPNARVASSEIVAILAYATFHHPVGSEGGDRLSGARVSAATFRELPGVAFQALELPVGAGGPRRPVGDGMAARAVGGGRQGPRGLRRRGDQQRPQDHREEEEEREP